MMNSLKNSELPMAAESASALDRVLLARWQRARFLSAMLAGALARAAWIAQECAAQVAARISNWPARPA